MIIVSSELNEIIGMCDRILTMYEGEIVAEISGEEIDSKNIMYYVSGAHQLEDENK